jgi:hypothetical protein
MTTMKMRTLVAGLIAVFLASAGAARGGDAGGPIRVEVVRTDDGYELRRGGEPFLVRGVGGAYRMDLLAESGGNAVRTWGQHEVDRTHVGDDGVERTLLDHAHRLGLAVCAGFWMQHPRHGFDYGDERAVEEQLRALERWVRAHKDHPAVLVWGLGNEVEINADVREVFPHLNDAARLVKSIDPDHPTMIVISELGEDQSKVRAFMELCPDVDILGINAYGGLPTVAARLDEAGFDRPFMVTEYGHLGPWEVDTSSWGAPKEPTSTEKADRLAEGFDVTLLDERGRCVGGFAFLWGHKQERTSTWFGIFLDTGERTAMHDVLVRKWTGAWPENRAPAIEPVSFHPARDATEPRVVAPGARVGLGVRASDPDGDALRHEWVLRRESWDHRVGGDREQAPPEVPGRIDGADGPRATLRAPEEPGEYRVFVFVYDGRGAAATANAAFLVR